MSDPLFLLGAGALDGVGPGAGVRLDGAEGRHAATVRRIAAGERVDVADGAGTVAHCLVAGSDRAGLDLTVREVSRVPARLPRLVLVQALAKGGRDELAVETATELGVDEVWPWQAARSVVRWSGERGEKSRGRWVAAAREAAKQSRRATVPVVGPLASTADLVRAGGRDDVTLLVLHEAAPLSLASLHEQDLPPAGSRGQVLVVVGPEGGVEPGELEMLTAAGGRAVRLGPEVLRTSSAGPAALAVLSLLLGRWG